jgi:hypothetical protein
MRPERCLTRIALRAPVEFNLWNPTKRFFGFATDISERGVFIETPFPALPLSAIALRMWPWGWEEVVVAGVVRWKGPTGMGVEFLAVGPREAQAIRYLVIDWGRTGMPAPRSEPNARLS